MSRIVRRRTGGRNRHSGGGEFQTINITPFTDVLLVLLIIFLIAGSSLNPTGVDVDKLATIGEQNSGVDSLKKEQILFVAQGGSVTLSLDGNRSVDPDLDLLDKQEHLTLTAHPDTNVNSVVKIYDELLRKGFQSVHLGEPRDEM